MQNKERWLQRLQNLNNAFERLCAACDQDRYTELELAGLIQTYEFTFELAWKTMKDRLQFEGYSVNSPRSTIMKAYEMEWFDDVDRWLGALNSRNLFSHTYDKALAEEAGELIKDRLKPMISALVVKLNEIADHS